MTNSPEALNAATAKQAPAKTPEAAIPEPLKKFRQLVRLLPASTPDEQIMFGYGGTKISAGDLREVVKHLPA